MSEKIKYHNSPMSYIIDECIHSERDRALLKRRYIDGIMIDELTKEFKLSPQGVRRVIDKNKVEIFREYEKLNKE